MHSSIALASCRSPFLDDAKIYCPLATLYLAAYINARLPSVTVRLIDDGYSLDNMDWLDGCTALGISIMTPQRREAVALADAVKRARPNVTIIGGGPHVRHYHADLVTASSFDYLVPYDGENALVSVLSDQARARLVRDVLTREAVALQPRPDRSSDQARALLSRYTYTLNGRPSTTMMTARGCPERCTFCEDAMTQVRPSSLVNLRAELDDICQLGYRGVYIFDDLFTMSLKTVAPICAELARRSLVYRCNAQARYFTRDGDAMAQLLAESGCYEIAFGAESGSQTILDAVGKRCSVSQNYQTVACAKRHGLIVKAFMLIGLPGETEHTLAETEAFVRDSGIDDFQCAVYMPFRGTQIREAVDAARDIDLIIEARGYDGDVTGAYATRGGETAYEVRTRALSAAQLREFRDYLVRRYRPASHLSRWTADRFFDQAKAATERDAGHQVPERLAEPTVTVCGKG